MSRRSDIPVRRQIVYATVVVVVFFVLAEGLLALVGIQPIVVQQDPYVGFSSYFPLFVAGPDGRMATASNKLALFNPQSFDRRKKPGTYRIFTLGGSTTYGRPFDDGTSFTGWLRTYLETLDPERSWEVVNAGGISYASYRVATLMEELVEHEPDLFVIYSGNNEFLEKRTYGELIETLEDPGVLTRTLQRTRLWAAGKRLVHRRKHGAERRYELTGEVEELLNTSAGLDYYQRDAAFARQVFEHYRFNLRRMIDLGRMAGARVVLVTVPVNEKDFPPFKSQHADGSAGNAPLERATRALDDGNAETARQLARESVEIDPLFAESHFVLGRALTALGQHDLAAAAYDRALAEDVCPLRAGTEIDRAISEIGSSHGVDVIDFRAQLKSLADHGTLGDEFFFDHVHPRPRTNGLLARALVEWMGRTGILEIPADLQPTVDEQVRRIVLGRVDAETEARAYKNLAKVLVWAGQTRAAEGYLTRAGALLDDDWEAHYNGGLIHLAAGRSEDATVSLLRAVELNPRAAAAHDRLGAAYAAAGKWDLAVESGRRATAEDPALATAWSNLATHYEARGNREQAIAASNEALSLAPDLAEAHNNLGNSFFNAGRVNDALVRYDRAIALRPGFADAYTNRGLALGDLGRFDEALRAMDAALAREPALVAAHLGRAKALLALGEVHRGIESLQHTIELDPRREEAYELLVAALESLGQSERAASILERGLDARPDAAGLHHLLGRTAAGRGDLPAAARAFTRALELDPAGIEPRSDLVRVLLMQDRVGEAVPHLVTLGLALEELGQRDRALEFLRQALTLAPETAAAREGVRRLASVP